MPRLLATQSHVVYGYVGNKAATFPLQCLGWNVDCCNSVQFSNHTGYGLDRVYGSATSKNDLEALLRGLLDNFSGSYNALLSGYLPNRDSVRCVGEYYTKFKEKTSKCIWLMDPVMGDEGQLYVRQDVIPEYKKLALDADSEVDIITPNQFEFELLYDRKITDSHQLRIALETLHHSIPIIILTSADATLFADNDDDHIYLVASIRNMFSIVFRVPRIRSYFTGVGDLFSALLIDRMHHLSDLHNYDFMKLPKHAFETAINDVLNTVQNVLLTTQNYAPQNASSKINSPAEMKEMELRIIESKKYYEFSESVRRLNGYHDYSYLTL